MTTAQDQQSRAEFEALAESLGYDTTDLGHGFCHADTRKALKVWQAARALPAPKSTRCAAAYEDGKWYWVEREGWYGEPPTIAPACYKAECDAWYSYIFSGISTPYLKVLGPCELQAARALPAGMGHLPACPFPCDWEGLHKIAVADGAYLARIDWPEDEEGVSVQRAAAMRTVTNLIDVCRAILAATPKAPNS